jgi:site-specific recombinase XerD
MLLAGQLAPSSIQMYKRDFAAYVTFCGGDARAALDPASLGRWRTHLAQETTLSPNTINRMLSAVKRLVKEAAAQGYVPSETAAGFRAVDGVKAKALKQRTKRNARTKISPVDMRRLCEAPSQDTLLGLRDRALLLTLATSGARVSEIATLTREQILERDGAWFLKVMGKNQTALREAPLSPEAVGAIQAWLTARAAVGVDVGHIFTGFGGRGARLLETPMAVSTVWRAVQRYAEQEGVADIKPHDFRRFVGTQLARMDIRKAQKALGHKRIDTTATHYVLDELEGNLTDDLF